MSKPTPTVAALHAIATEADARFVRDTATDRTEATKAARAAECDAAWKAWRLATTDAHGRALDAYRGEVRAMALPPDGERVAIIGRLYPKARATRWVWAVRFQAAPGLVDEALADTCARFVAVERAVG